MTYPYWAKGRTLDLVKMVEDQSKKIDWYTSLFIDLKRVIYSNHRSRYFDNEAFHSNEEVCNLARSLAGHFTEELCAFAYFERVQCLSDYINYLDNLHSDIATWREELENYKERYFGNGIKESITRELFQYSEEILSLAEKAINTFCKQAKNTEEYFMEHPDMKPSLVPQTIYNGPVTNVNTGNNSGVINVNQSQSSMSAEEFAAALLHLGIPFDDVISLRNVSDEIRTQPESQSVKNEAKSLIQRIKDKIVEGAASEISKESVKQLVTLLTSYSPQISDVISQLV